MLGGQISNGALFYGQPRRRTEVQFTPQLRARTEALAARMHQLHQAGKTPHAAYQPKCDGCSLIAKCLPRLLAKPPDVARYLARALAINND